MSDIVPDSFKDRAVKLAIDHVEWFFEHVRPLMITEFIHGYRHGWEDAKNEEDNSGG